MDQLDDIFGMGVQTQIGNWQTQAWAGEPTTMDGRVDTETVLIILRNTLPTCHSQIALIFELFAT